MACLRRDKLDNALEVRQRFEVVLTLICVDD